MVSATKLEGEYSFLSKNSPLDQSEEQHGTDALKSFACADQGSPSLLDTIILSQWEDFAWKGQLGYDVTACKLKVIAGERNFIVQLNDKWNSFFLKEYDRFLEPFGCLKPNCMKNYEELLMCIAQGEKDIPEVVPSTTLPKDGVLLIANAYPVEYGHIFLVPSATNPLPCFWDKRMFGLITKVVAEVNSAAFRVFFDNGTSIVPDRMFFQACYFANPLPVESASTVAVYDGNTRSGILMSEIVDYPLRALVFTANNINTLVNVVSEVSFTLHDNNTAYSLLISNNGTKVFLFPQVKNLVTGCSLSAWECGGYFVYHTKFDFDRASETEISNRMTSVSLQDAAFEDLKNLCCAIADDLVTEQSWGTNWSAVGLAGKGGATLMICRTCGEKDLAPQNDEAFVDRASTADGSGGVGGATKGPKLRRGGSDMRRRNDENSVRVSNLSEDTYEPDLFDLFSTFGHVTCGLSCDGS